MNNLIEACNACIKKCHELKEHCTKCSDQCTSKHPIELKCTQFVQKFKSELTPILYNCVTEFNEHFKTCTERNCKRAAQEAIRKCEELLELAQECSRICKEPSSECGKICTRSKIILDECSAVCTKYIENSCDLIPS